MSQFIFNDGNVKGRLIRKEQDWFVGEWKSVSDINAIWFPWIAGTAAWLGLTEQEKNWAK